MSIKDRRDLAIDRKDFGIMDKEIELNRQNRFGNKQKGLGHNAHRD